MWEKAKSAFEHLKLRAEESATTLRERYGWLDHLVRAGMRFSNVRASRLAAACTYSTFLALFPLLILVLSIFGYALASYPAFAAKVTQWLTDAIPTLQVREISDLRLPAGIIALVGVILLGLNWVAVMRGSIRAIWLREDEPENPFLSRGKDALSLVGLSALLTLSIALTFGASGATRWILDELGVDANAEGYVTAVGYVVAVVIDSVFVFALLGPIPRVTVDLDRLLIPSLIGGVGLELIKYFASFIFRSTFNNPAYAIVLTAVIILVFFNLVYRLWFFCAALSATAKDAS